MNLDWQRKQDLRVCSCIVYYLITNVILALIHDIVGRGGRCLMPVFALGRAQELLLILDEYWEAHPELDSIPIYYASSLAKRCMAVYQTYINMMNARIRKQFAISNPFVFKHISNLKNVEQFEDSGPCVMMASPGMLQVYSLYMSTDELKLI